MLHDRIRPRALVTKAAAIALYLAVFGLGLTGNPAHANPVLNNSFEDDGVNLATLVCPVSDWSGCPGNAGATANFHAALAGRAGYLAIGTTGGLGFISQDIATTAGADYLFSFDFSSDGEIGNRFQALWDGNVLMDVIDDPFNAGWSLFDGTATFEFLVTATSDTTTISFAGTGNGASFIGVDDVFVVAVPEPATLALFGLGLAGLGFARRGKAA